MRFGAIQHSGIKEKGDYGLNYYIVEDDLSVISNLEDIIEANGLGAIVGDSGDETPDPAVIMQCDPDIVMVDFLMPDKDGIQLVRELRAEGCTAKCVMLSQMSTKSLIAKAYDAGIDYFVSKPINVIEIKAVLGNVIRQIENERTLSHIRGIFGAQQAAGPATTAPVDPIEPALRRIQNVTNQLGMSGEKGTDDLLRVCRYLLQTHTPVSCTSITKLCETLSDTPKNMEQRLRRALAQGLTNIAHLGIEDFMNETFARYAGTLFQFEEVRAEMDYIRGTRPRGGKVNIKKFVDSLLCMVND